ncbi:UDP-glucose 4-epimerase GalE [Lentilactobacillus kefiri]|uniref:UDP-glucose 4-epimerase n=2 Tax=Lentilactobacillus kefiri TaxID=33962 RepID=A0A8E1RH74_LENKE|nr:UDP-glucose 4-epimerase GalE [Lentilactobacillus kefiri]KRL54272.1 UDP-glucose 4-epimerase [Lentilactobacillus parakefiri DSM 10551]KRM49924.1 UDP-glucose 4-epimerase [Lentilactobacillus kefiri DSM 20587 = JCM 5818]MCJ2161476.1 UDP-glucose 4-epimerase GalE [Lentilactobacillus kefiri]MCP9368413.1 UDP-glucose 4-epimerase GalE [Lentilactobacillus kefiri]MDH5107802.1 UDP-glucose 4-epimerase GalE [Lentilactobacillus kefiri]
MAILVLGGAGYIGSHTVDRLIANGYDVAVVDNLVTGHKAAINPKARFYEGDVRDKKFLNDVFDKEDIEGVIHFAAFSVVPESMKKPLKYFDNNTGGMISLLEVMNAHNVKKIVFSSTAATYGEPKQIPIKETDPQVPTNPYGESKLAMEKIMHWSDVAYGIKFVALRYFNVAGAKPDGSIGEDHHPETHLVPIILQVAAGERDELTIFGDDYDTPDGTNVRDYVHVMDLADAHILALKYLQAGHDSDAFNLGSSTGFSNKQMLDAARDVTGKPIPAKMGPRRAGDPSTLIAASDKARKVLGWKPQFDDVHEIIKTAWNWKEKHPKGYDDQKGNK